MNNLKDLDLDDAPFYLAGKYILQTEGKRIYTWGKGATPRLNVTRAKS